MKTARSQAMAGGIQDMYCQHLAGGSILRLSLTS
jgi:hypothetical protein